MAKSDDNKKVGPTGKFPEGKISPDDKGELGIHISIDDKNKQVRLDFKEPIVWLSFGPEMGIQFAACLHAACMDLLSQGNDDNEKRIIIDSN